MSDSKQPSRKPGRRFVGLPSLVNPEKDFLRDIFRDFHTSHHMRENADKPLLVIGHKTRKREFVTGFRAKHLAHIGMHGKALASGVPEAGHHVHDTLWESHFTHQFCEAQ